MITKKTFTCVAIASAIAAGSSCTTSRPEVPPAPVSEPQHVETAPPAPTKVVKTSVYGDGDGLAGKRTASGETFDPNKLTAAHRSLPFGTKLQVKNPKSGKSVQVRVNDRGPFVKGRGLDLSPAAASRIGLDNEKGTAKVEVKVVGKPGSEKTGSEKPENEKLTSDAATGTATGNEPTDEKSETKKP